MPSYWVDGRRNLHTQQVFTQHSMALRFQESGEERDQDSKDVAENIRGTKLHDQEAAKIQNHAPVAAA